MSISKHPYAKKYFNRSGRYAENAVITFYPDTGSAKDVQQSTFGNALTLHGKYLSTLGLLGLDSVLQGLNKGLTIHDATISYRFVKKTGKKRVIHLYAKAYHFTGDYYISYTLSEILYKGG